MPRRAALLALLLAACRGAPPPPVPTRLVVAYPGIPANLLSYLSGDEFTASVLRNAYEPLVDIDRDLSLAPCLAESWHSPDELTWVFRLRRGVKLHDGRPLEAGQVAAFLEDSRKDPRSRRRLQFVTSVEAPDASTVVMRTDRPSGVVHGYLNSLLVAVPARNDGPPVGTGRYAVRSFKARGEAVLSAFDAHRDGAPPIRDVVFRAVPDARERARLLRAGEADLTIDVDPADFGAFPPGIRTHSRRGLRVVSLGFEQIAESLGGRPNPFRDVRVRRAAALAVDRAALVAGPLGGHADVVDEVVPPEIFGHHGAVPARRHDREEARRLLAEAGHAGRDVDLEWIAGRYRGIDAAAEAVVADLRAAGFGVRPRAGELGAFRERVQSGALALFLVGWLSATADAMATYDVLLHTPREGHGLYSRVADPTIDRLLEETARPISLSERRDRFQRLAVRSHETIAVAPLYRMRDLYAASARLSFVPRLDRRLRVDEIRWSSAP